MYKNVKLAELRMPNAISKLDEVLDGFKLYQTVGAALELKLFDQVDRVGSLQKDELVAVLEINESCGESFFQVLVESGFLVREGDYYQNSELASKVMVSTSPYYQGDWLKARGNSSVWDNLTERLLQKERKPKTKDKVFDETLINVIGQRSLRGELQRVVKTIADWEGFKNAKRVVDVGGGHGLYAIALCQLKPDLEGFVFDQEPVTEFAQKNILKAGLENRVRTVKGDLATDELPPNCDIVFISHLLYKFRDELPAIIEKMARALNSGGIIVSNHWFHDKYFEPNDDISVVQKFERSLRGEGRSFAQIDEFENLLEEKGFTLIRTEATAKDFNKPQLHMAIKK